MTAPRGGPPGEDQSPAGRFESFRRRATATGPALTQFADIIEFAMDDFQVESCQALERGSGVLVAAPTGAGKTVVGEFAVHLALASGRKAFYTTPIKALSNQKYADFVRRYGPEKVGLLTGDSTVNGEAPIVVMTTEVLRNMLYADSPTLEGLGFVVMDEVHYLADRFRGPVWEEVILHLSPDVQLVSLSATVSNAEEFGDWLELVRGDTAVVVTEHRPVPLGQHVLARDELYDLYAGHVDPTAPGADPPINPDLRDSLRRQDRQDGAQGGARGFRGRGDRGYRGPGHRPGSRPAPFGRPTSRFATVDLLAQAGLLPAIFFIFSRAGCEGALAQCVGAGLRLTTPAQEAEIRRIVAERCEGVPHTDLQVLGYWDWLDSLSRGLAAHHAGMLPMFKETVEDLFSRGLVKAVFATETLALGINMPARSVVLEKLVKWDGSNHVALTPGEYTQLTGRAGRRGIDTEGHAVVVNHPGLDPVALAGLASKRLYPLKSAFRPTYNMAVNLVAQVGPVRAREILEMSFAQFQADRGVVGLARQAQTQTEALIGYAEAMTCHVGDFSEYAALRRDITQREKAAGRAEGAERKAGVADALSKLHPGDVVQVTGGRRSGFAVVIEQGTAEGFDGPRPTVLGLDKQIRRLAAAELPGGVRTIGALRLPKNFTGRNPGARRELLAALRSYVDTREQVHSPRASKGRSREAGREDAELASLRRRLKAHPCHQCPEREDHARWAERWARLDKEHDALTRRIEGRTGSIARVFDRICEVLDTLGYLRSDGTSLEVTADGESLRHIYAENDLLVAECLRTGAWDALDAPGLAAAVSSVVYNARRDDQAAPRVPGGPQSRLALALDATVRVWSRLDDLESDHQIEATSPIDLGIVEPIHRWAAGRSLESVLRGGELAAGDFVRWCKQVIDLLDQLSDAAPTPQMRATARQAVTSLRRGVVAYSSL